MVIIVILKMRRMREVTRMQRGIPHVYRVGRLLNMRMRRRDPTKVLRGCLHLFPRAKVALQAPALNCFAGKTRDRPVLQTGLTRRFRDIKAGQIFSQRSRTRVHHHVTTNSCPQTTPFWQLRSCNVDFHHHYANFAPS